MTLFLASTTSCLTAPMEKSRGPASPNTSGTSTVSMCLIVTLVKTDFNIRISISSRDSNIFIVYDAPPQPSIMFRIAGSTDWELSKMGSGISLWGGGGGGLFHGQLVSLGLGLYYDWSNNMMNDKICNKAARIPYTRYAACVKRYAAKNATTHYSRYDSLHTVSVWGMRHALDLLLSGSNYRVLASVQVYILGLCHACKYNTQGRIQCIGIIQCM